MGEIVVGQVSKSRIRARCDESARPDFAKTNLLLMSRRRRRVMRVRMRIRMFMRILKRKFSLVI